MTIDKWDLPDDYITIIQCVAEDMNQSQIAAFCGTSRQNIKKKLKRLVNLGMIVYEIRSSGSHFRVTSDAERYLPSKNQKKVAPPDQQGTENGYTPDTRLLRGHDYSIYYYFETKLKPHRTAVLHFDDYSVKVNDGIKNWTKAIIKFENYRRMSFTAEVSPSSLHITGFDIRISYLADIRQAELEVLSQLSDIVKGIEAKLQDQIPELKISRKNGILQGKIKTREWAFEKHPIATASKKHNYAFTVHDGEGNLRANVDYSLGFPEFETHYAPEATADMSRVQEFTRDQILGNWNHKEERAKLSRAIEAIYEISKREASFDDRFDRILTALERIAFPGGYQ